MGQYLNEFNFSDWTLSCENLTTKCSNEEEKLTNSLDLNLQKQENLKTSSDNEIKNNNKVSKMCFKTILIVVVISLFVIPLVPTCYFDLYPDIFVNLSSNFVPDSDINKK